MVQGTEEVTRPAFQRDNILSDDERAVSGRKCLSILASVAPDRMRSRDRAFYEQQVRAAKFLGFVPSEPTLQWLRDLVERYAQ